MLDPVLNDNYQQGRIYTKRLALAFLVVLVLISVLVVRYAHLQVAEFDQYRTRSDRNRVHIESVPPKRGLIFDRRGVLIAENKASYNLTIVKERVVDLDTTLEDLKQLLDITASEIEKFKRLTIRHRPFEAVPLRFKLTEQEIAMLAVNSYRLPGTEVTAQLVRNYPRGPLFDHSIGYVGRINESEQQRIDTVNYAGTHQIGKVGLEKFYEHLLHGTVGYQNVETNAQGKVLRVLERTDPIPGKNLTLFIDSQLQSVAREALGGERGSVVAIDTQTGGVLAMVSTPSFNPNLFVNGISQRDYSKLRDSPDLPLFNRSLQGQYPPGSTIKPVVALAGLEADVVSPSSTIYDPGWYTIPDDETKRRYRDWKAAGHGKSVDLRQAIAESCDVYFYKLVYELGIDRLHGFTDLFGLGKLTHIDSTSEKKGLLPSREWKLALYEMPWFPGETLSAGIGQGYVLATPLQLAQMTAIIANRGKQVRPRLLKSINDVDIPMIALPDIALQNEANWEIIVSAMKAVVHSRKGTAKRIAKGASFVMAGKTGTAQVIGIKQDEKYDAQLIAKRNRDHALFVGFAPLTDPKIAVAVVVENGEHGSSTAAPIARKLFDTYLLPPDDKANKAQTIAGSSWGATD